MKEAIIYNFRFYLKKILSNISALTFEKCSKTFKGISDNVDPVTDEERASYTKINFDMEEYRKDIGCKKLLKSDKTELLMNRWRFPTLSLHGIEGAYSDLGY
jgi:nonspecific dipeptidase